MLFKTFWKCQVYFFFFIKQKKNRAGEVLKKYLPSILKDPS